MRRYALFLTLVSAALILLATRLAAGPGRHPMALKAEQEFFEAFTGNPSEKSAPLRGLWTAAVLDPQDARTWLLLGLDHLWMAAEGDRRDPTVLEHLVLAERFLVRAQELDPGDQRIPSWLVPARLGLARFQGQEEQRKEIVRGLVEAYAKAPAFHSFSVALLGVDSKPDSPEFQRGLAALRATAGCGAEGNLTCNNTSRWPHNREGYQTFHADYELKAGNLDQARQILLAVRSDADYPRWPFRAEVEDRLQNLERYASLYANADPKDDPPHLMSAASGIVCQRCHLGS